MCPEGFQLYNDPFPDFQFGELIPPNTPRTVWNRFNDYVGMLASDIIVLPDPIELLNKAESEIESQDTTTLCIKVRFRKQKCYAITLLLVNNRWVIIR